MSTPTRPGHITVLNPTTGEFHFIPNAALGLNDNDGNAPAIARKAEAWWLSTFVTWVLMMCLVIGAFGVGVYVGHLPHP